MLRKTAEGNDCGLERMSYIILSCCRRITAAKALRASVGNSFSKYVVLWVTFVPTEHYLEHYIIFHKVCNTIA